MPLFRRRQQGRAFYAVSNDPQTAVDISALGYSRIVAQSEAIGIRERPGNRVSEIRAQTGLRGVAALYVVIFHYFQPIPFTTPILCLLGHGYLAVDLFFPLSGFVMALNYSSSFSVRFTKEEYKKFLGRRFARIYPLYLVVLLIACGLALTGRLYLFDDHLGSLFLPNLFLIQNWGPWGSINPPSWSISAEWFAYLLFPFLMFASAKRVWGPILAALLCVISLTLVDVMQVHANAGPKLFDMTHGALSLVRCVSEFLLGMLAYRLGSSPLGFHIKRSNLFGYGLPIAIVLLLSLRNRDLFVALLFPLFTLRLAGAPTIYSRALQSKPVEYLGLLSYSIYMLHFLLNPVIGTADTMARRHGMAHSHTFGVAAGLVLLFPLSATTYHLLEVPARRRVRELLESKGAQSRSSAVV